MRKRGLALKSLSNCAVASFLVLAGSRAGYSLSASDLSGAKEGTGANAPVCTSTNDLCGPNPILAMIPTIVSVSPAKAISAGSSTGVLIKATSSLAGVSQVLIGTQSVQFTIQPDGTVSANAPPGVPGSTVGITAILNNKPLASNATFAYPSGELDVYGPLPSNTTIDGDNAWFDGRIAHGYSIEMDTPSSGVIPFGRSDQVFHVTTSFHNDLDTIPYSYNPPAYSVGNMGLFTGGLEECEVGNDLTGTACSNWDGNQGVWKAVPGSTSTSMLSAGSPGGTVFGDMTFSTAGLGLSNTNLIKTIRYTTVLGQGSTTLGPESPSGPYVTVNGNCRCAVNASAAFNVVVNPSALMQINAIPYTIIYEPPGDQSKVTFSTMTTYGTQYSLTGTKEVDNSYQTEQLGQVAGSLAVAFGLGLGVNGSNSWDNTTKTTYGTVDSNISHGSSQQTAASTWTTTPDTTTIPGSGVTCAKSTDCSTVTAAPANLYQLEPFWEDTFALLVHSQMAVWTLGSGQPDRWIMYAAVPAIVNITVSQLDACAKGLKPYGIDQCVQAFATQTVTGVNGTKFTGVNGSLVLTSTEAKSLLALDPFYTGGQDAQLDPDPSGSSLQY